MPDALVYFAFYPLWLVVSGTIGNLVSFCVCFWLRKNTTFVFLAFITIVDTASLYYWNLSSFLGAYFGIDLQNFSIYSCRIGNFIQFASLQSSAWLMVLMSVDRLASVLNLRWNSVFSPKRAAFVCAACVLSLVLVNSNVIFLYGESLTLNGTQVTFCFSTGDEQTVLTATWALVHSLLYSYCPFTILLVTNSLFICVFKHRHANRVESNASRRRQSSMNRTVVFITALFILMTLPGAIISKMYSYLIVMPNGRLIITIFGCLSSSYHAYRLLILYFTNQKFANQLRSIFGLRQRQRSRPRAASTRISSGNINCTFKIDLNSKPK